MARRSWCGAIVFAAILAACGSTEEDGTKIDAGDAGDAGNTESSIDCSRVGCAPPPMCSTGCTETCGCCSCAEGEEFQVEGGVLVCTGGCYAFTQG